MDILLIAGGWSTEREISLKSAAEVAKALDKLGHRVIFCDLLSQFDSLISLAKESDCALIMLHGSPGEDGLIQAMLERVGCPYQGANSAASFLALHKAAAKQLFRENGLPTADWEFLPKLPDASWQPGFDWPLFVKSNSGGSSIHLGRVANRAELDAILAEIFQAGECAILEPALKGQEVTCGILDEQPLPPVLIEPVAGDFFDFKSKYADGGSREICPAPLAPEIIAKIQDIALKAHQALGLSQYSRADFILTEQGPMLLEVNTLPGMTKASLIPKEANAIGLSFEQLVAKLLELALKRKP